MSTPSQAVVLCGGLGTRLRPFTIPSKTDDPMQWQTFLKYLLAQLTEKESQFCLLTGYLGERIQEYFGNGQRFGGGQSPTLTAQRSGIRVGAFGRLSQSWKSGSCYFILIILYHSLSRKCSKNMKSMGSRLP